MLAPVELASAPGDPREYVTSTIIGAARMDRLAGAGLRTNQWVVSGEIDSIWRK